MSVVDVRNPGQVEAVASEQAVTAVVDRARPGQRSMAAIPAHERAAMPHRFAGLIESEKDSLATLLPKENGKPIRRTVGQAAWIRNPVSRLAGPVITPPSDSAARNYEVEVYSS